MPPIQKKEDHLGRKIAIGIGAGAAAVGTLASRNAYHVLKIAAKGALSSRGIIKRAHPGQFMSDYIKAAQINVGSGSTIGKIARGRINASRSKFAKAGKDTFTHDHYLGFGGSTRRALEVASDEPRWHVEHRARLKVLQNKHPQGERFKEIERTAKTPAEFENHPEIKSAMKTLEKDHPDIHHEANMAAGHSVRQVNKNGAKTTWGRHEAGRKKVLDQGGLLDQHVRANPHLSENEAGHDFLRNLHKNSDPDVQTWANTMATHKSSAAKRYSKYALNAPALVGAGAATAGTAIATRPKEDKKKPIKKLSSQERTIELASGELHKKYAPHSEAYSSRDKKDQTASAIRRNKGELRATSNIAPYAAHKDRMEAREYDEHYEPLRREERAHGAKHNLSRAHIQENIDSRIEQKESERIRKKGLSATEATEAAALSKNRVEVHQVRTALGRGLKTRHSVLHAYARELREGAAPAPAGKPAHGYNLPIFKHASDKAGVDALNDTIEGLTHRVGDEQLKQQARKARGAARLTSKLEKVIGNVVGDEGGKYKVSGESMETRAKAHHMALIRDPKSTPEGEKQTRSLLSAGGKKEITPERLARIKKRVTEGELFDPETGHVKNPTNRENYSSKLRDTQVHQVQRTIQKKILEPSTPLRDKQGGNIFHPDYGGAPKVAEAAAAHTYPYLKGTAKVVAGAAALYGAKKLYDRYKQPNKKPKETRFAAAQEAEGLFTKASRKFRNLYPDGAGGVDWKRIGKNVAVGATGLGVAGVAAGAAVPQRGETRTKSAVDEAGRSAVFGGVLYGASEPILKKAWKAKMLSSGTRTIALASAPRPTIAKDRYEKSIDQKEQERRDRSYVKSAVVGGALGHLLKHKLPVNLRKGGKAALAGAGAGIAANAIVRTATGRRDQYGDESYSQKRIQAAPAEIGALAAAGIAARRIGRKVRMSSLLSDVINFEEEQRPVGMFQTRRVRFNTSKAQRYVRNTKRVSGLIGDLRAGGSPKLDAKGRPAKKEWEKPWVKTALWVGGTAAVLGGAKALHSKAKTSLARSVEAGTKPTGLGKVYEAYQAGALKSMLRKTPVIGHAMRYAEGMANDIKHAVHGPIDRAGDAMKSNIPEGVTPGEQWVDKATGKTRYAPAGSDKAYLRRRARRKEDIGSVHRTASGGDSNNLVYQAKMTDLIEFARTVEDWEIDNRSRRTAVVRAPDSQQRFRRNKTWLERKDNREPALLVGGGLIASGASYGGYKAYQKRSANRKTAHFSPPNFDDLSSVEAAPIKKSFNTAEKLKATLNKYKGKV